MHKDGLNHSEPFMLFLEKECTVKNFKEAIMKHKTPDMNQYYSDDSFKVISKLTRTEDDGYTEISDNSTYGEDDIINFEMHEKVRDRVLKHDVVHIYTCNEAHSLTPVDQ
ncbi:hypothetical protein H4R27_004224 [Coemansia aciculifera]|nr:hypothetical protein H4R27_004224 [Coemansia aciculifera]